MEVFDLARTILNKLVVDSVPFALVLRQTFKKGEYTPLEKSNVTALVGCELRHHYIFSNLISRFIGDDVPFEKTINLRFYLANHLFLKRFNDHELLENAKKDLDPEGVELIVNFVNSTNELIPEDLDKSSPEYLSLRYNTPAWVIRMWQKQYGKGIVFKLLKTNYRPSVTSVRIVDPIDAFLGKHPDYSAAPIKDMVLYQGKGGGRDLEEIKNQRAFYMKMATKYILDSLDLDPIKSTAIYSETPNNIFKELFSRFGRNYQLDYVINHSQSVAEARKLKVDYHLEHLYIYDAPYTNLMSCISKKVDVFICLPRCSMLDLLRSTPDYFLRVKQDELDSIIEDEFNCLEECEKFVADDGELIYMIPTLSRKESNSLIANFLVKHPSYSLIEEHQFFPFENFDSCIYFARMKKMGVNND